MGASVFQADLVDAGFDRRSIRLIVTAWMNNRTLSPIPSLILHLHAVTVALGFCITLTPSRRLGSCRPNSHCSCPFSTLMEICESSQATQASLQSRIASVAVALNNVALPEKAGMVGLLNVVKKAFVSGMPYLR